MVAVLFSLWGGNYRNCTQGDNALSLPMLLQWQKTAPVPERDSANQKFCCLFLAEWYVEDSPQMTWVVLAMPIKKTLCNSLQNLNQYRQLCLHFNHSLAFFIA